jgi:hypothetical protein
MDRREGVYHAVQNTLERLQQILYMETQSDAPDLLRISSSHFSIDFYDMGRQGSRKSCASGRNNHESVHAKEVSLKDWQREIMS